MWKILSVVSFEFWKIQRTIFVLSIALCVFSLGCDSKFSMSEYSYPYRNDTLKKTVPAYKNIPSEIEKKEIQQRIDFSYPTDLADINKIFHTLEKYKKDEFTTDEQYISNMNPIIKRIMKEKDYIIFKALNKKDVDGSNVPTINYYIDKRKASVVLYSSFFNYYENSKYILSSKIAYTVTQNTKVKNETGVNVFGISNTYEMERGIRTSLFFENLDSIIHFIEIEDLSPDIARSIKGNMDVFFVVSLETSTGMNKTIRHHDISTPTIDTIRAWSIKDKILVTHLKAILICNKTTKEIVRTLYF